MLSGFLITYLLISEYDASGKIELKNFYIRRVLRIWPLYYAVLIFVFFIYPFIKSHIGMPDNAASKLIYYITFLSNFDVGHIHETCITRNIASQDVTWSVSIEEQFYLFWPLVFTFLPRRFWGFAISLVILSSFAFRIVNNENHIKLYFHTLSVLLDLGIGGLAAYFIKTQTRVKNFFESTSTPMHIAFFALPLVLSMFADIIFTFPYAPAISRVVMATSYMLIIASQAMTTKESILNLGHFSFGNRWGKYTYGIYLVHPIAIQILDIVKRVAHVSSSVPISIAFMILAFCLTLLISWVSYEFFESKFLALKRKFEVIKTAR